MFIQNPYVHSPFRHTPFDLDPPIEFWTGEGSDEGLFAYVWEDSQPVYGRSLISHQPLPTINIDSRFGSMDFSPMMSNDAPVINGYYCWKSGAWRLYCTYTESGLRWVLIQNPLFLGYSPSAVLDEETGVYSGDGWFEASSIEDGGGLDPRGTFRNEGHARDYADITFSWPRWRKTGFGVNLQPYGVYTATEGETGTKTFGVPSWKNGIQSIIRSAKKADGNYCYYWFDNNVLLRTFTFNDSSGKWIADGGWMMDAEPSPNSFIEVYNDEEEETLRFAWSNWVAGMEAYTPEEDPEYKVFVGSFSNIV